MNNPRNRPKVNWGPDLLLILANPIFVVLASSSGVSMDRVMPMIWGLPIVFAVICGFRMARRLDDGSGVEFISGIIYAVLIYVVIGLMSVFGCVFSTGF